MWSFYLKLGFPEQINDVGKYTIILISILFAIAVLVVLRNVIATMLQSLVFRKALNIFQEEKQGKFSTDRFVERISGNTIPHAPIQTSWANWLGAGIVKNWIDFVKGALSQNTSSGLPHSSIVSKRIRLLYKIRQIHSVSTELLTRQDRLEERSRYRFVRFVTNVLLVLGLLGTVFGLTIAVKNILPAIDVARTTADVTVLIDALMNTMTGLQTAFYTTLAALGLTFLLASIVYLGQKFESAFRRGLEVFITYDLIPEILISSEVEATTLYIEAVERSAKDIAHAADTLESSRDGIKKIVDGLVRATERSETRIEDFYNFARTFETSVSSLMGYNDDIKKLYADIQGVLQEIQQSQVTSKIIEEVVEKSVAHAMKEAQEGAKNIRNSFKDYIAEVMQAQNKYSEAVEETAEAIRTYGKEKCQQFEGSNWHCLQGSIGWV